MAKNEEQEDVRPSLAKQERLHKNKALEEQVHFLQTLIDAIPSPIFYKDTSGVYRGCNRAFEDYLGRKRETIIGKSVFELVPPEIAAIYQQKDEALFKQPGVQIYESTVIYSDGSKHDVIFNKATYVNAKNELDGLVGIITDITQRKRTEQALERSSQKLQKVVEQIVQSMAMITETRDLYTAGHQRRVSDLAVAIAREMKFSAERVKAVQVAGMLHDIGKIAVPAEILAKPGKLTIHELGIVRNHAEVGYSILKNIDFPWPIAQIVYQHHERLDGSGYPCGIQGTEILLEAQILAVADVVEAMSSHRPYRPSLGLVQAITEINLHRDILYGAGAVEACIGVFEKGFSFAGESSPCRIASPTVNGEW